jgi:transcription-repair coupling factor (superfamily II helicase)
LIGWAGLRANPTVLVLSMTHWLDHIQSSPAVQRLASTVAEGGRGPGETIAARGASGSSTAVVSAALHRLLGRTLLLVTAHLDDADEATDELESLGVSAARFPAVEIMPGETGANLDLVSERLMLVRTLAEQPTPQVIIAPIQALMQHIPAMDDVRRMLRVIEPGAKIDPNELAAWLTDAGYSRVQTIENGGEFAVRGGIIDIFPPGGSMPVRLDLFGDEVEAIHEVDVATMGSDRRLERIEMVGSAGRGGSSAEGVPGAHFADVLPRDTVAVLAEMRELVEQGRGYIDRVTDARGVCTPAEVFQRLGERVHAMVEANQLTGDSRSAVQLPVQMLPTFAESATEAVKELAELSQEHETIVLCRNEGECQRMGELLAEFAPGAPVKVEQRYVHRGFIWGKQGGLSAPASIALIPSHELLHRYHVRRRVRRLSGGRTIETFLDLQPGDYVVHREHGIARFLGLRTMDAKAGPEEYLTLEFARGLRRHVPVSNIELVQKYIGAFTGSPELSTIGGKKWKRQTEQAREAVRDFAAEMLRLQAAREAMPGIRYPADTAWQREFEAEFPYDETEDQLAAIIAAKRDMTDPRPMDRLVCGDVGFGKTEVAMRAAFKAAEYGKQVAVLVPTTVLCEQHERTFRERFAEYPFRIESLSRFKMKSQQQEILKAVAKGQVDIIIGTHRLLSKDVKFADLGLVVIDEEQRFGVEHKQKLLTLRATADVLTLSATPIPRTLHMALLGLRDISSLTTPPLDRRAIVTEVLTYDSRRVEQAIARELAREGQIFFVHNRVHNIEAVAQQVQRLAPNARVIVGHGQMPMRQLERVMLQFIRGQADILVCTTIIESGIDLPRVNTIFINDADTFGLSELHQLRGRVGRFKHRAYCYLMVSPDKVLSEVAMKRLRAIESFSMLGAGFKIALRDLEIRGAGNLLGEEQSGHIAAVGYEMYCQLLEQEVAALRDAKRLEPVETTIDIGISGALPRGYIPSDQRRMDAYRRVSLARSFDDLSQVERDLVSAYGSLPTAAQTLMQIAEIRIGAAMMEIDSIRRHESDIIFRTRRPDLLERAMTGAKGTLRPVGTVDASGMIEVYYRPPPRYFDDGTLLPVLRKRMGACAQREAKVEYNAAPSVA